MRFRVNRLTRMWPKSANCYDNSCMCGRYRLSRRKQIIEEYFETADWQDDWSPRHNIAPTQPVPVVQQHPKESGLPQDRKRSPRILFWGLRRVSAI